MALWERAARRFILKPGNYYTNYSLRCGVITSPRSGEYTSACTPAEARAARWNSCSTPFSLADIWPLVMFAICTLGGREKNRQKLLIAQQKQEWKAQVWPSVQPTPFSLAKKLPYLNRLHAFHYILCDGSIGAFLTAAELLLCRPT